MFYMKLEIVEVGFYKLKIKDFKGLWIYKFYYIYLLYFNIVEWV